MPRSTDAQKTERLNAAHGALAGGLSVAQTCVALSRRFALSRRQAYRYVRAARALSAPATPAEATVAATFKLPPRLLAGIRARAAVDGTTIGESVARALAAYLDESGDGP